MSKHLKRMHINFFEMKTIDDFFEEVSIAGLREAATAKSPVTKVLWFTFVVIGLTATGIYIYKVVEEYQEHQTATKVNVLNSIKSSTRKSSAPLRSYAYECIYVD